MARDQGVQDGDVGGLSKGAALKFVVFLGVVSLFADVTYEGARSITGPYLAILGASATVVGIVAGLGELAGYALRLATGYLADRTKRYWTLTMAGYVVNLLAVPALALAGSWQVAAVLIVAERTGKAIRNPARDAMLSHATKELGRGWGFGLHEALDQIGAVLGPVVVAGVVAWRGAAGDGHPDDFRWGFAVLLISALLALALLAAARISYPTPHLFEREEPTPQDARFPRAYWLYLAAVAFVAAGYADFPLIAYHFQKASVVQPDQAGLIPLFYATAMAVDAVAALLFGRLFDRHGLTVLVFAALISALFAPLVFFGGFALALLGMAFWGIGMGAQESIMRAAVASFVPANRRGTAYGIFNAGFGVSWFAGSALMGILYDSSIPSVVVFSVVMQLASIPLLLRLRSRG